MPPALHLQRMARRPTDPGIVPNSRRVQSSDGSGWLRLGLGADLIGAGVQYEQRCCARALGRPSHRLSDANATSALGPSPSPPGPTRCRHAGRKAQVMGGRRHVPKANIQRCHKATTGRCCAAVHHATGRHIEPTALPLRPQDGSPPDSVEQGLGRSRAGLRHALHLLPRDEIGRPAHLVVGHQSLVDLGLGKDDGVEPGAEPRQQVGRLGRLDEVAPHHAGSVGRRHRD